MTIKSPNVGSWLYTGRGILRVIDPDYDNGKMLLSDWYGTLVIYGGWWNFVYAGYAEIAYRDYLPVKTELPQKA